MSILTPCSTGLNIKLLISRKRGCPRFKDIVPASAIFLRKGKRAKKRTNVLFFAEGKEVEQSELCSDVSKPHEKNIFGISAVGGDLWNSQKVGSDSEPS